MGRPPAYIFVVRHGNRLDAADKQWHLSSPTPYDPPLTYSGWQQAKTLGARIGSILRDRIREDENAVRQEEGSGSQKRRKRYKVVLHSSPFLRCIQTAIAISAGIAQDPSPLITSNVTGKPLAPNTVLSPRARPSVVTEPRSTEFGSPRMTKPSIQKSVLRLDAFLGEWLTPDYFEHITPPPESVMMLAGAKADLLRREDYNSYPHFATHAHSNSQGQLLWGAGTGADARSVSAPAGGPVLLDGLENMSGMASTHPRSGSINSYGSAAPRRTSFSQPVDMGGYVAPVPSYAVSSNAPIPMGYVAHARDACVDIDYQWDSMRAPLDWGNGGSYGEEWTAMHGRFRKGAQKLVDWYTSVEAPTDMVTKTAARWVTRSSGEDTECAVEDSDDFETEAVVILVSHGAGCNALIGALTHRPVLTDVAMTSLTMAVRRPCTDSLENGTDGGNREEHVDIDPSKASPPIHQLYEMKLFANTDHLRSAASTPRSPHSPSVANGVANGMGVTRGRYSNSISSTLSNFSYADGSGSRSSSANGALNGFRVPNMISTPSRSSFSAATGIGGGITVGSGATTFTSTRLSGLPRRSSVGLWSPITALDSNDVDDDDDDDDDDAGMLLNFSHEKSEPTKNATSASPFASKTAMTTVTAATLPCPLSAESRTSSDASMSVATPPQLPAFSAVNGRVLGADPLPHGLALSTGFSDPEKSDALSPLGLGIGFGGLWKDESVHDLNTTKRRWTVTERT